MTNGSPCRQSPKAKRCTLDGDERPGVHVDNSLKDWPSDTPLIAHLRSLCEQACAAYKANPILVDEHANLERAVAQGSYGRRQVYELVQNGADALLGRAGGTVHVVLTETHLYCANEGSPIDDKGVQAILHSHLSVKRRNEIGRFGLGFKSVLGVTRQPEFFCRSGSFAFDAARSAEEIRAVSPRAEHFPVLRLAYPLDPLASARDDSLLAELMTWATTVVRLSRADGDSSWLEDDINEFPSEFLLFCPHIGRVVLENRSVGECRTITLDRTGEFLRLNDGVEERAWRVFERVHKPSPEARREAGELADREELPLVWAVPVEGRLGVGSFWAFFPLRDETTLSGIVNAPWKTNDDRTSLLPGRFNRELLNAVARLVADNLPQLRKPADPAWHLDVIPARGREARCWADQELTQRTYDVLAGSPSLPDQAGTLHLPSEISVAPEGIPRAVLEIWSQQPKRPESWCHYSAETRERRPRVVRLADLAHKQISTLASWMKAVADGASGPAGYGSCIAVAAALIQHGPPEMAPQVKHIPVIPDEEGVLRAADDAKLFLPGSHSIASSNLKLVHAELLTNPIVVDGLRTLGLQPVSAELELDAVIGSGFARWTDLDWTSFWDLVGRCDVAKAVDILRRHCNSSGSRVGMCDLKVRTLAGRYEPISDVLLPGPVVPGDGSRDKSIAVDMDFHSKVIEVIVDVGAVARPTHEKGIREGESFRTYRRDCIQHYYQSLPSNSSQPDYEYLDFAKQAFAGPLEPILRLSEEGRALFTAALLESDTGPAVWTLKHKTNRSYPTKDFESPILWHIRRYGRMMTSLGHCGLGEAVGPDLAHWKDFFPVAEGDPEKLTPFGLPNTSAQLSPAHWKRAFAQALNLSDERLLGRFYTSAVAHSSEIPALCRCRVGVDYGDYAPREITVVTKGNEYAALVRIQKPCILIENPQDAELLVNAWHCKPASGSVQTQLWHSASSEPTPLLDLFPGLRWQETPCDPDIVLIACNELRLETLTAEGKTSEARAISRDGSTIYWRDTLSRGELLERLNDELRLGLTAEQSDAILRQQADQARSRLILEIRSQKDDAARLLTAIGEDKLRPRIPASLVSSVERLHGEVNGRRLAELALVVYGAGALQEFRAELAGCGLQPPQRWAGSRAARKFVADLGFGREFAGSEEARRDPVLMVDGPRHLPPLHNYQRRITEYLKELLDADEEDRRGLLSLPTGAGKTRVAVQALSEAIRDGGIKGAILWVAQQDELCEQAVQTWKEVWRAEGAEEELQISRLWAQNDAQEADGAAHVVVATIQKLSNVIEDESYAWLSQASVVVIDEAHGAIAPTYTDALTWLGIDRKATRCPLIGLTATPFRGRSAEETERLAYRFGHRRLDRDLGDDPYRTLQDLGVLSKVEHRLLKGVQVNLSPAELDELRRMRSLPASVYDRIGGSVDRNKALLDDILALPRDWRVLLFAASVEHAQTMAALLTINGIKAATVSSNTDPGVRRHCISAFKSGEVQVLTNYNVLTQGFDAPATRAIYVARPTFSPNTYQQMIGRGLRGPKNGGKDVCLIVNVEDNIAQYGEQLAFRDFEYLWNRDGGKSA